LFEKNFFYLQDIYDDDWIFDPAIDAILDSYKRDRQEAFSDDDDNIMTGGGIATTPLLEFQLRPTGARRNWKNVLNKQRFEATLEQKRDVTNNDDLGIEVTNALQRAIER